MSRLSKLGLLAMLLLAVAACGGSKDKTADAAPAAKAEAAPAVPKGGADETVAWVMGGLAEGRPEVLWHALPASYQKDVTKLVHDAADEMDAEVWNRTFAVLNKLGRVMNEKREFILAHPMVAGQLTNPDEADANWDAVVGMFDTIVQSDLSDLDKVRQLDVEQFLAKTGGKIMQRMAAASALTADDPWAAQAKALRAAKASVVSGSGDNVVVRFEMPGKPMKEEAYVRVEGKWVPKEMADGWQKEMAEAQQGIVGMSGKDSPEKKQQMMMQLAMAEGALDTILAADTADEFNASLGSVFGLAMGAASQMTTNQQPQPYVPAPQDELIETDFPQNPEPAARMIEPIGRPGGSSEPELFDPDQIGVGDAAHYVGQWLRVEGTNGLDFTGELVKVENGTLYFEKRYRAGTASFEIGTNEVRSMRLTR